MLAYKSHNVQIKRDHFQPIKLKRKQLGNLTINQNANDKKNIRTFREEKGIYKECKLNWLLTSHQHHCRMLEDIGKMPSKIGGDMTLMENSIPSQTIN